VNLERGRVVRRWQLQGEHFFWGLVGQWVILATRNDGFACFNNLGQAGSVFFLLFGCRVVDLTKGLRIGTQGFHNGLSPWFHIGFSGVVVAGCLAAAMLVAVGASGKTIAVLHQTSMSCFSAASRLFVLAVARRRCHVHLILNATNRTRWYRVDPKR